MDRKKDTDPRMGGMKPKSRAKGADKKCPGVQKRLILGLNIVKNLATVAGS